MKIYSNFQDYYDGSVAQFRDDNIAWVRKDETCSATLPSTIAGYVRMLHRDWTMARSDLKEGVEKTISFEIVGFCGRFYPFVREMNNDKTTFIYGDDILKTLPTRSYTRFGSSRASRVKQHRQVLKTIHECHDDTIFIDENTPSFHFYSNIIGESICIKNPNLSELKFFRQINPWFAMIDLSAYFSSILTRHDDIPEADNKTKIKAAGFDLKTSFRKAPTK